MSEEKDANKCCADADVQKLKVLAIHGYRQNGDVFHQKTGSFRKMVHKWAQFTYITAPHKVVLVDNLNGDAPLDVGQSIDSGTIICYPWVCSETSSLEIC